MDKKSQARALVERLTPSELAALCSVAAGESVPHLARRLSIGIAVAAEIKGSMKRKLGAVRDADAVRVALYAGMDE
jgi:DNA-binding CsgD family transcriptional regulator